MTRAKQIPFWPDSDEPPLDRDRLAAHQLERGVRLTEEQIDRYEQVAIGQRLWLMKIREVEPIWRERGV